MKKKMLAMLLCMATAMTLFCVTAWAGTTTSTLPILVNNEIVEFPDQQPYADKNNRTLVPVRFVTEALGAEVTWNNDTRTATIKKDGITVDVTIGSKVLKITDADGKKSTKTMDTEAVITGGRTMVPIRFVAESLGAYVDYSSYYKAVEIVMPEDVTAEEITRLRSYDMIQTWNISSTSNLNYNKNGLISMYPALASFTGTGSYWFSNSHLFLISYDQNTTSVSRDFYGRTKLASGANARTYAKFALECAKNELETASVAISSKNTAYGMWSTGNATVDFRTDESLTYQQICPAQAYISVRGIMDVKCLADYDRGLEIFAAQFGIDNPEYGKTYSIDAELIMAKNSLGYVEIISAYRLDTADGTPLALDFKD
jgi:hypothetical protein